jgi:hypothetical protein
MRSPNATPEPMPILPLPKFYVAMFGRPPLQKATPTEESFLPILRFHLFILRHLMTFNAKMPNPANRKEDGSGTGTSETLPI